ncbi:DEAD/DEAH box helicase [Sulfurospirillum sp. T05]|uniref:DEAD/DEAH box helicase n=1 Tax=Sulfurospirillum tamanense TaxID=2813362 RepID=A0ABS2WTX1_9BACT|nr:DEAD/DEAH box helicase [Sulfurospirillum tamanensis]MBN2965103.1 DEAD/DEAH box helicase [Sulfurospirillum tamanensis]
MPFSTLGLSPLFNASLLENGFTTPTPIQHKVIPLVLENKDIIALAQTGSGKTASFVLPLLHTLSNAPKTRAPNILVLTPTRELAVQVAQAFSLFGSALSQPPRVVSIIGGEGLGEQMRLVQQGCDVVVATPGRLLEILQKGQISLYHVKTLVLDEADKMLSLGFSEALESLLHALPSARQNLLFSASYPPSMETLARTISDNFLWVNQESAPTVQELIQRAIKVDAHNRGPLLRHLLSTHKWAQVLVFMSNKRAADNIAAKFHKHGFNTTSFHGNLSQEERVQTLEAFKTHKVALLFATDIAARGLDIKGIECVVNFDLPRSTEDYIHRVGRTARAGRGGESITFVTPENHAHFALIQKRCHTSMALESISGFESTTPCALPPKGQAPVKGKRKSKKDKLREKAQEA